MNNREILATYLFDTDNGKKETEQEKEETETNKKKKTKKIQLGRVKCNGKTRSTTKTYQEQKQLQSVKHKLIQKRVERHECSEEIRNLLDRNGGERYNLCLCMIVKNESHIIIESLTCLLPYIDVWVIVDTGSTDDTREKICAFFQIRDMYDQEC